MNVHAPLHRIWLRVSLGIALAVAPLGSHAFADDSGTAAKIEIPKQSLAQRLQAMRAAPASDDPAPIWDYADHAFQKQFEQALQEAGLLWAVQDKRLSIVLMDITNPDAPALASLNGDQMVYAASLPKIGILLGAFEEIASGSLQLTPELNELMEAMIRRSSNTAATEVMNRVGKERIAEILTSERYRLYDPARGGGLWLGKDYAKAGLWKRDPIHNLSHGASAMEVARFWYMMETGNLVSPEHSRKMREICGVTHLNHKFAKALMEINESAQIMRKSGSWRNYHADSAVIRHSGYAYILVGLVTDKNGGQWLETIQHAADGVISDRQNTLNLSRRKR
jgi:beta-lactamase class A